MNLLSSSLSLAVCLPFARAAGAQEPGPATPFSLTPPPMTAANIDEPHGDGVFWVRGGTYKARVDAAGVTFLPLFPGAAVHTPLRFRCRGAEPAKVERDGQALVLRRGPSLVERWQAEVQGMEQVFVLSAPPATPDLTLRVDVETDLRYRGYDRGLVFAADGLGTVTYGEGVVFDGKGRRAAVVPELENGSIALHVPSEFLAGAEYPVTIDPFVSSFTVSQAGSNDFHPDIVHEPQTGDFLVIFEEVVTASDHDVVAHHYREDGTFVSRVFFDSTSDSCTNPKVCATLGASGVLAVWDDDGSSKGIQARLYKLTLAAFEPVAQVTSDGALQDSETPDVGGGTTLGVNNVGQMCVFARTTTVNHTLRGIRLQSNGIPIGGEFTIDGSPGCDPRPDISPSGGNPLHWVVVWQSHNVLCNNSDVWFAGVNLGGVTQAATPLETGTDDELLPRAFTFGSDTLICWHEITQSVGHEVAAALMRRSSGTSFAQIGPRVSLSAGEPNCPRNLDQNQVAIGFDGCRHSYTYMENQRPKAACVTAGTYQFSDGHAALSATTNACGAPVIAHVPTPTSPVRYAVVWQEDVGPRFEIRGAFYEGRSPNPAVTVIPTACGAHGITGIRVVGMPALGREFDVALTNVSGLPLLIAGPAAATPVTLCALTLGPCRQGITNILVSLFAPTMTVRIPCDPNLVGDDIAFQGADLGAANGCGTVPFGVPFRTTDTLVVSIQ